MPLASGQIRGSLALLALLFGLAGPRALVGAQDLPTYEPRVEKALALLDTSPATAHLRSVLDANRVAVKFVPLGAGVYARYSVARHTIEIDDRWVDAGETTLAAVIAHEGTHAQDSVSGYLSSGGASACIDSEVRAFRTAALFWLDRYGSAGKPGPVNDVERQLNAVSERQVRDPQGLEALVQQTYTQQCAH